jgi:hypothetical protein
MHRRPTRDSPQSLDRALGYAVPGLATTTLRRFLVARNRCRRVRTGITRQILGGKVSAPLSGKAPERRQLEGTLVLLEPLDAGRHSTAPYAASHESDQARRIWTYLPDGPFDDIAAFDQWVRRMTVEPDRLFFAFRDKHTGRLGGMATYLDIRPEMGSIEMGYIWFAPFLQRTREATEAMFLMLR